ncbi:H-NS family histone-like protein [Photobacterium leiognathi]|uniref:H-NS family histone-like protein n=1 Tax=Photobacterium leiognathi TaxID=553611 RepID=UPI002980E5B4|nr:H-NS family nucleoid-associated regulatory protein [Photobacterium leiognathi]
MTELLKTLTNLRSLRAYSRECTIEQLEEALEKLTTVVSERRQAEEEQAAIDKERNDKLEAYREMLLADGIDPEDLLASLVSTQPKAKRTPRPAKYKFLDDNGQEKTWTGQGRTPRALQKALDEGKQLEEFEI